VAGNGHGQLTDLRDAEESGRRPRPRHIRELIEDGLIDRTLGLTARGRRALALDRAPARHAEVGIEAAISIRGSVPSRARENLARALTHVAGVAPQPVLHITASLDRHEDLALDRPFVAKATLDVNGRAVRAQVAAASVSEAIHLLEGRLHRNLRTLAEHDLAERREEHLLEPGEWRHGDLPSPRPSYFSRPAAERRLIRRKSYASAPTTPEAAVAEMLVLDHDFRVFVDEASGEDALVHTRPDGVLALRRRNGSGSYVAPFVLDTEPVPTIGVGDAIERLNLTDEPFLFFVDASSGRGAVLYRRYDGHYGLVSPVAA
jgi:ribosome-associated translation inhibitor RaiA